MSKFALGIDLGTTFSSVSVVLSGKSEIVADKFNDKAIPSIVNMSIKDEKLTVAVGNFAYRKSISAPKNTIYDTKRMLATRYDDENIQKMIPKWPFEIEKNESGGISICLENIEDKYEPYQISGEILKYLAEVGNTRFPPDKKTKDVVITVPANFGNDQRSETIKAAEYAGLNVLSIINEPTAAGIAFGFLTDHPDIHDVFVFDFGGGTLDVSLLNINENDISVKATDGDMFLGGRDFDENTVEYLINELGLDESFTKNPKKMFKFREAIIDAKKQLSGMESTTIISEDDEFEEYELSLQKFEEINKDLIDRILSPVERLLANADIDKSQIDAIILVGGSSNMQFVKRKLHEFFGKEPFQGINPEEAVSTGAGLVAAKLISGQDLPKSIHSLEIHDICPFTIGTSDMNGSMTVFIKKDTEIPFTHTEKYKTIYYRQKEFTVDVYEGEAKDVKDNRFLDDFTLYDLPESDNPLVFEVTFTLDRNSILSVNAKLLDGSISGEKEIKILRKKPESDDEMDDEEDEDEDEEYMSNKELDVYYKNMLRFLEMNQEAFTDVYGKNKVKEFIDDIKARIANDEPEFDNLEEVNDSFENKFETYFEDNPKPNFIGFVD